MIISIILGFASSLTTDRRIDELFPNIGGATNLIARYVLGGCVVWSAYAILNQDENEPNRTEGRQRVGLAFLLVGLGVAIRRIWEAVTE